jgi:hypothetical protein
MSWKKTNTILTAQLNRRGMSAMVTATQVCEEAEAQYPDQFHAVSLRKGTLHIEVPSSKLLAFKLIEGKLLQELNQFAATHNLQPITRIRLTINDESGTL